MPNNLCARRDKQEKKKEKKSKTDSKPLHKQVASGNEDTALSLSPSRLEKVRAYEQVSRS
jgi:hypothetical protein